MCSCFSRRTSKTAYPHIRICCAQGRLADAVPAACNIYLCFSFLSLSFYHFSLCFPVMRIDEDDEDKSCATYLFLYFCLYRDKNFDGGDTDEDNAVAMFILLISCLKMPSHK